MAAKVGRHLSLTRTATMKKLLTLLLCTALLSGCGWHLRGSLLLPEDLQSLHISAKDSRSALVMDIQRLAETYGIELVEQANQAQFSVAILDERDQRRTISVGNDALASEFEITHSADYRIDREGEALIERSTATVSRAYDYDPNDVVSKNEEELLLRREMRLELVQQIMRRLRSAAQASRPAAAAEPEPASAP